MAVSRWEDAIMFSWLSRSPRGRRRRRATEALRTCTRPSSAPKPSTSTATVRATATADAATTSSVLTQALSRAHAMTEAEHWEAAEYWVREQVLATFRHRAILQRLEPVRHGVADIDVTHAMLSIELPPALAADANTLAPVSAPVPAPPLAPAPLEPLPAPSTASQTSAERMVAEVRARIRMFDAINDAAAAPPRWRWRRARKQAPSIGTSVSRTRSDEVTRLVTTAPLATTIAAASQPLPALRATVQI